jgi:hypothetical protein
MNHKATATCRNGHKIEWGPCKGKVKKLFGGVKDCGMKRFEQIYSDGRTATVSFDDQPWNAVRCMSCNTVFTHTTCPQCGVEIPVSSFEKKGLFSKLG